MDSGSEARAVVRWPSAAREPVEQSNGGFTMAARRNPKDTRRHGIEEKPGWELALGRLRSEDVSMQISGAELLGHLGLESEPAIPHLIELLFSESIWKQTSPSERFGERAKLLRSMISVLGKFGRAGEVIVPRLLTGLVDRDVKSRRRTARILRILGEKASEALKAADFKQVVDLALSKAGFKDEDLRVRCDAIVAVAYFVADKKSVALKLLPLLKDKEPEIRETTMCTLVRLGEGAKAVWRPMVEHLSNEPNVQVWEAIRSLVRSGLRLSDEDSFLLVTALVKGLATPDAEVRLVAADLLGDFEAKAAHAIPKLIEALRDEGNMVADMAAKSLGQLGPLAIDAVPALIEARSAAPPDSDLRYSLNEALKVLDPRIYLSIELHETTTLGNDDVREPRTFAVRLGDGRYKVGGETLKIGKTPDKVLGALVSLGAAMKQELADKAGVRDACRHLRLIVRKYPLLAPYISLPGRKGQGGYRTTIKPA